MVGTIKPSPQTTVIDVGEAETCSGVRSTEYAVAVAVAVAAALAACATESEADLTADHRHQRWWTQVLTWSAATFDSDATV